MTRVVDDGDVVLGAVRDLATRSSANSPRASAMTKEVMWSQLEIGSLQAGIDLENRGNPRRSPMT